jgi:cytochrome oxidase Cu insertion factor (SCO1/SenC/PrrC family)
MRTIKEILVRKIQGIDCTEEESAEIKGYIREQKYKVPYEIQYWFTMELAEVLEEDNVQPIFINTEPEDETKPYRKRYGLLRLMTDYEGTTCTTYEQAMRRAVGVFYADTKDEILTKMIEEFNSEELSEMHKVFLVDHKEQTILLSPKN